MQAVLTTNGSMLRFHKRITLWFVSLSSVVYLSLTLIGLFVFYDSLNDAMDNELKVMMSEFGHAVDYNGTTPTFRDWIRSVQTEPKKGLATIELFDLNYNLLEHHGPHGIRRYVPARSEVLNAHGKRLRAANTPLIYRGKVVGYMQVEVPTAERDKDFWSLLTSMVLISPLILIGFGVSSYIVAGKAAAPLAESIEKMKNFVADAGHELNTPLSILRARLETLERKHARQNIDTADLNSALSSMSRMEKVIEDLMLLAEFDAEIPVAAQQEVVLADLIAELEKEFSPRFQEKGVVLKQNVLSQAKVRGEQDALHRAVSNLVENALRYTDSGGTVTLELSTLDGFANLAVIDTGIGISEEDLKKIFDRFFRSDKSRSRASGGVGLGLAIVQSITYSHSGKINVSSQPGKGSCFKISLPLSSSCTERLK
jgi:signal transduction histidine kinase